MGVFFLLVLLFGATYFLHQQQSDHHEVYTVSKLAEDTRGTAYTLKTFGYSARPIASFEVKGLALNVSTTGNLSGGNRAHIDTINVMSYRGNIGISGSTIVAYPKDFSREIPYQAGKSEYLNDIAKNVPEKYAYTSDILLIKTPEGNPIIAFYGDQVKPYYCDIDNSQVFSVDGHLIYLFNATYSLTSTSLFR